MERQYACCFTGHRPDKLPWHNQECDPRCAALKAQLFCALEQSYEMGFHHYLCGMARGTDLYFAQAVLELRHRHPEVTLEAVRPCESQANSWSEPERRKYHEILDLCDYETLIQYHYDRTCMTRRNRYMVDHAAHIIAVYNGIPQGGTAQTLSYALRQGLTTDIIQLE